MYLHNKYMHKIIILITLILTISSCSNNNEINNLPIDAQKIEYEKQIQLNDKDYMAYYNLAMLYMVENDSDKAIKNLNECIKSNPEYSDAYNDLGYIYLRLKETDKAILQFKKAIFIKEDLGIAHYNLALAYFEKNQLDLCLKHIKLAKFYDPQLTEKVNKMMLILP